LNGCSVQQISCIVKVIPQSSLGVASGVVLACLILILSQILIFITKSTPFDKMPFILTLLLTFLLFLLLFGAHLIVAQSRRWMILFHWLML